jgi:hypothetical protein
VIFDATWSPRVIAVFNTLAASTAATLKGLKPMSNIDHENELALRLNEHRNALVCLIAAIHIHCDEMKRGQDGKHDGLIMLADELASDLNLHSAVETELKRHFLGYL